MTDTELMTIDPKVAVTQYYGDNELLDAFVERLTPLYKGADAPTVRLIAQLAIATGANPLPSSGEIWNWPQWDSATRSYKLTVALGVQYYRRNVADQNDVVTYVSPPDLMSEARAIKHGASDKDIVAECSGYLKSQYAKLRQEGFSMVEAERRLTRRGVGRVAYAEMFAETDLKRKDGRVYKKAGEPFDPPKGRTWLWVAEKRAEKDLLTKIVTPSNPLTARIQEMNRRNLQMLQRSNAELPPGVDRTNIDEFNEEFFDTPRVKIDPVHLAPPHIAAQVIEGENEQVTEEQSEKVGRVPDPVDWIGEMLGARTLDQWAYRAAQSDWGKVAFNGQAVEAKKFAKALCPEWTPEDNAALTESLEQSYKTIVVQSEQVVVEVEDDEETAVTDEQDEQQEQPEQPEQQTEKHPVTQPYSDSDEPPTNWEQKALKAPNLSAFVAAVEQLGLGYNHQQHIRNTLKGLGLTWKHYSPKELLEALKTYKED